MYEGYHFDKFRVFSPLSVEGIMHTAHLDTLRFQIEFNFRDAKQFWGLEDFMNISPVAVNNTANLSLFMVNLVRLLLAQFRKTDPLFSVLDLKAYCRGRMYVSETIKMLPKKPGDDIIARFFSKVPTLGRIHLSEFASLLF
jgi:hypothetical protein